MKRFINLLPLAVVAMFMTLMSACSDSSNSDVESLLKTVPQETSGVVVVDLGRMLDKVGIEAKDGELVLPAKLKEAMGKDVAAKFGKLKGVKADALVVFMHRKKAVVTGYVSDQEAFRNYVKNELYGDGGEWNAAEDNLDVYKKIAVRGDQFWYVTEGVSTATILGWAKLKEAESAYANNKLVAAMCAEPKDVSIFYDIDRMKNLAGLDAEQVMAMTMMQEIFVRDMAYASGWVDFGKDEVVAEMRCYNSKFEAAEYVVELDKIDTSLLGKLPKSSNFVMAFGADSKMWATLCSAFSEAMTSLTGNSQKNVIMEKVISAVRGLDGTVMAGGEISPMPGYNPKMMALVETKDAAAARDVMNLVTMFAPEMPDEISLTTEDKFVKFAMGDVTETGADNLKSYFEGKLMTVYMGGEFLNGMKEGADMVDYCVISAETMDCMTMRIKVKNGGHANILEAIAMMIAKNEKEITNPALEEAELDYEDILIY